MLILNLKIFYPKPNRFSVNWMEVLDDANKIKNLDPSGMLKLVEDQPQQIKEALKLSPAIDKKPEKIVVCGVGGSAIGGEILSVWARDKCKIPIQVNRGYTLPSFVDKKTLLICVSYSGETEETISCFKQGVKIGCQIVSISSGGTLSRLSRKNNCLHISIPSGIPPRAAIFYTTVPQLMLVQNLGLARCIKEIKESVELLEEARDILPSSPTDKNPAKQLAIKINHSIPCIFGAGISVPAAKRWRTQFNENSKIIAREDELPEENHNDIVGWFGDDKTKDFVAILLRDKKEHKRIKLRFEFLKDLLNEKAKYVAEVWCKGKSDLAKIFYWIHFGDFVSLYLAFLRNVDPTPVSVIQELKMFLSKKK